jgi:hypothetical protein
MDEMKAVDLGQVMSSIRASGRPNTLRLLRQPVSESDRLRRGDGNQEQGNSPLSINCST